ncbi:hypothetical protein GC163_13705 [bacterium]|nr:hypothetical protein [bacterium]
MTTNESPPPGSRLSRQWRGWLCLATFAVAPLGWFVRGRFIRRLEPERLDQGLVLILPGIEGRSFLNIAILQGLLDASVPYALEIVDWTTGNKFLALYHLRSRRRNLKAAAELAQRIVEYQRDYPGRPVWIIGHSGGGGMALWTALALPEETQLTGLVLLAAAISPGYELAPVLTKLQRGLWTFSSYLDCIFTGLGTTLFGTLDGRHGPAVGMVGFHETTVNGSPFVTQCRYHPRYVSQFNLGGHFGCVHRVFVEENIAPILMAED